MSQPIMQRLQWHSGRQVKLMSRRKIVFVIVEGPSDDEALGVILNRLYQIRSILLLFARFRARIFSGDVV